MTESLDEDSREFAFGAPVLPSEPSALEQRDTFVLGAYPSGLHVSWTPPQLSGLALKPVKAMIVDNEPNPFWVGDDAASHFVTWKSKVGWLPDWGTVKLAAAASNGPSGKWVDAHILRPLHVDRGQVCISDCLDESRLNAGQARRIADTYVPATALLGLPACTLRPVPAGDPALVSEAVGLHLDRLRTELRTCRPRTIVTLGNAALRVAAHLLELGDRTPKRLTRATYGIELDAGFEGSTIQWLPLVHPRSGERTPPWPGIHRAWESIRS